jgi:hypothetical protein
MRSGQMVLIAIFSYDIVDCGSDSDQIIIFNSGDDKVASNCEEVQDFDR